MCDMPVYPKKLSNEIDVEAVDREDILFDKLRESKDKKQPALFHRAEWLRNPVVEDMSWNKIIDTAKLLALRVIRYRLDSVNDYSKNINVIVTFKFPYMIGNVPFEQKDKFDFRFLASSIKFIVESYGYTVEMDSSKDFSDVTYKISW